MGICDNKKMDHQHDNRKLIDLASISKHPLKRWMIKVLEKQINQLLCIEALNSAYCHFSNQYQGNDFFNAVLEALSITYRVSEDDRSRIPLEGGLIVLANHPYGGLDGILLGHLFSGIRKDVKFLGNNLLAHISEFEPWLIPIDIFRSKRAAIQNVAAYRKAIQWVKNGGVLIVFPAGEVSHVNLRHRRIMDPPWNTHVGTLVRLCRTKTLPVFIPGRNSLLFNLLGLLNPKIRTAMLSKELINKKKSTFELYIGRPIPWVRLATHENPKELVNYLRLSTDLMGDRQAVKTAGSDIHYSLFSGVPCKPLIHPVPVSDVESEIKALPASQTLIQHGNRVVYIAEAMQIPSVLRSLTRLREITFRKVGEGTQKACDEDRFDDYYQHLFLWDKKDKEVVGAYRLGRADRILKIYGPKGLYTSSLFSFDTAVIDHLHHAVELGRSFIQTKYQKQPSSLMMLWQGIGRFIANNPQYRILFGAVSISNNYHALSKDLMVRFLLNTQPEPIFKGRFKPRCPYPLQKIKKATYRPLVASIRHIEDVSCLVANLEKDGKGIPILIKHYLKLNAQFINFNIDKHFSHALDGLIWVDLRTTDPRILKRFMGNKGLRQFSIHNGSDPNDPIRLNSYHRKVA